MKRKWHMFIAAIGLGACAAAGQVPEKTAEGFMVPQPGTPLDAGDHYGAHPRYKIEWWYLTGHLFTASGQRFGYQATFFRYGLRPADSMDGPAFGNQQAFLAHMAVTDQQGQRFYCQERLSRDGWDAYAKTGMLDVRNGDWILNSTPDNPSQMHLRASIHSSATFDLRLEPAKPLVRFGRDGTSRKGPDPTARSFYLSHTRLRTTGTLSLDGEVHEVTGSSWMDHEIASSQLDPDYAGWDWIAIQLQDGWEVKAYLLRQSDGSASPFSALIWISPDGELFYRDKEDFVWDKSALWKSGETGYSYPIRPQIQTRHPITGKFVTLKFEPILDHQELVFPGTTYWEGAGNVLDDDNSVVGSAYLELVGYGGPIRGL